MRHSSSLNRSAALLDAYPNVGVILSCRRPFNARIVSTRAARAWTALEHTGFYPAIIAFLGYNPLPNPHTRGDTVRRERLARGWSRRKLSKVAGVDEATVKQIEANTSGMAKKPTAAILRALSLCWD